MLTREGRFLGCPINGYWLQIRVLARFIGVKHTGKVSMAIHTKSGWTTAGVLRLSTTSSHLQPLGLTAYRVEAGLDQVSRQTFGLRNRELSHLQLRGRWHRRLPYQR